MNHKIKEVANRMYETLPVKLAVKKRSQQAYDEELKKQTAPYAYWTAHCEEKREDADAVPSELMAQCTTVVFSHIGQADFRSVKTPYTLLVDDRGETADFAAGEICKHLHGQDLIYGDEDIIERGGGRRHTPFFKPDWSPDTFLCFQYLGGLIAVRTELACRIERQDIPDRDIALYDFLLKYTERADKICHIPRVLYHRYEDAGHVMPTEDFEKYHMVREQAKKRRGYTRQPDELVSVIIPSKDNPALLKQCIDSIMENTLYERYEIIVVDNGSRRETAREIQTYLNGIGARYVYEAMDFNFSKMCNLGAQYARGDYLLFLNDDITATRETDYMTVMLKEAIKPHVGAVGAKLLYPDSDIIQHVGITGLRCGPSHKLATYPDSESYYFGRNRLSYNCAAVTGACLMVSREKFLEVGSFHVKMKVGYNDIAFCASLIEAGYYNVIRNDVMLYHHESLSRGKDAESRGKHDRLLKERQLCYAAHPWLKGNDPFYNPNLTQEDIVYEPNVVADCNSRYSRNLQFKPDKPFQGREDAEALAYSLEQVEERMREEPDEPDYMYLEGWFFWKGCDNALTDRYLMLTDEKGKRHFFTVSPKYRTDVAQVFPKERHVELSGFVCRIGRDVLRRQKRWQTGFAIRSRLTGEMVFVHTEQEIANGLS